MPYPISRHGGSLVLCALLLVFTGCPDNGQRTDEPVQPAPEDTDVERSPEAFASTDEVLSAYPAVDAAVLIEPVGDGTVRGYLTFDEVAGQLQVQVNLTGLEPGQRAFHVHEHGSCEPDVEGEPAGAAGGHFNPHDHPHGAPDDPPGERHVGDFGNLRVGDDGAARMTFEDPVASLDGENSIVGRALIVHEGRDDLETQPTGDAGGRVGCGIIAAR